jgi:hypothetical protein
MNPTKRLNVIILTVFLFISLLPGCGAKKGAQSLGGSLQISVYYLGADTSRLNPDEVELFNKMATEMTTNLINDINVWGFKAILLETQQSTFNYANKGYLLRFSLTPHRMVSSLAQSMIGVVAGPNIIEDHFELIDLKNKKMITWGEYTRDSELSMEGILKRKNADAVFKIDSFINK